MSNTGCGGETGLYLNGSHPTLEDGEVTREVMGSNSLWWWEWWESSNQCGAYTSTSITSKPVQKIIMSMNLSNPTYHPLGRHIVQVQFLHFSLSLKCCHN